jgi:hypothetical protein
MQISYLRTLADNEPGRSDHSSCVWLREPCKEHKPPDGLYWYPMDGLVGLLVSFARRPFGLRGRGMLKLASLPGIACLWLHGQRDEAEGCQVDFRISMSS